MTEIEYSPPTISKSGRVVSLDFFKCMELAAMGMQTGQKGRKK